jgi:hypothetical protein
MKLEDIRICVESIENLGVGGREVLRESNGRG